MKVARLTIQNFRGVRSATLLFNGHTLLIGANNVGKSTICEALELVLGLDRLSRFPPVEEFDFYNAQYMDATAKPPTITPIEVEVVLIELSDELATKCIDRIEYWHRGEERVLTEGEADKVDRTDICECLRIKTIASYDKDDDEFSAQLLFCGGQPRPDGIQPEIPRGIRRLFGFVYLRALRTGSRALSLERGSLLDIILRQEKVRTGIWENAIHQLRSLTPPIDAGAVDLAPILDSIEERLSQYIPLAGDGRATQLFVSQLTREHLRKTISFFMRVSPSQEPVPFQDVGTGTLNVLVLALLSFIAEAKKDCVIFAMEEPEIALPPHTQRRIADYLIDHTSQCFVTSHSPYVLERFKPEQIRILKKDSEANVSATTLTLGTTLKGKTYRRHARRGLAEAMLGRGVIVGEGITERDIIQATAEKMEEADSVKYYPLDLAGVTVISVDGDGALAEFGAFFSALQIANYAFYDAKSRTLEEQQKLRASFTYCCQTQYAGAERMLVEEVPISRLLQFLNELCAAGDRPDLVTAISLPPDAKRIKDAAFSVLKNEKGAGYAGRLIELCSVTQLPPTLVTFMTVVYSAFPRPTPVRALESKREGVATSTAPNVLTSPGGDAGS